MTTQQIIEAPVKDVRDNPHQSKERDYGDIEAFALGIAEFGLLQPVTGCQVNGHYTLKIGHRRKRAFQWLEENWKARGLANRYNGYKNIPLIVEELSDDELFDHMVVENVHRKDLKPTEEATLLKQWLARHPNATSKEAGIVFGKNDATIRGMVRLLDLPAEAQKALDEGKISQNTARSLLSMQKVAPTVITEALKEIEDEKKEFETSRWGGSRLPEEIVVDLIEEQSEVLQLCHNGYSKEKPRAKGSDGWLLDAKNFPNHYLPTLTIEDAAIALGIQNDPKMVKQVAAWIEAAVAGEVPAVEPTGIPEPLLAKLRHLINPPACASCPFYTVLRGTHYCGMKTCHTRKSQAWDREKLDKARKSLGIAIYDPTADGAAFKVLEGSWDGESKERKLFKSRNKDLRLALMVDIDRKKDQYGYEGVPSGSVVLVVGKALQDMQAEKKVERVEEEEKFDLDKERRLRQIMLTWEASVYLQTLFDAFNDDAFKALLRSAYEYNQWEDFLEEIEDRVESAEVTHRRLIAFDMLHSACYPRSATCVKHAETLMATAKTWGVKVPARFLKLAEQADAEIKELKKSVSAETKGKK